MTLDDGSPLASSLQVVRLLAAELFRHYGGWANKIAGETFDPAVGSRSHLDFLTATSREPIGVVAAIVPPGMLGLKLAPALAAGRTVVLKTAELAPLVGERLAERWLDAGGPPGTFNLLRGFGEEARSRACGIASPSGSAGTGRRAGRSGHDAVAASAISMRKRQSESPLETPQPIATEPRHPRHRASLPASADLLLAQHRALTAASRSCAAESGPRSTRVPA